MVGAGRARRDSRLLTIKTRPGRFTRVIALLAVVQRSWCCHCTSSAAPPPGWRTTLSLISDIHYWIAYVNNVYYLEGSHCIVADHKLLAQQFTFDYMRSLSTEQNNIQSSKLEKLYCVSQNLKDLVITLTSTLEVMVLNEVRNLTI